LVATVAWSTDPRLADKVTFRLDALANNTTPDTSLTCGTLAYITNSDSNNVYVIDTATNSVRTTVAVGERPIGVTVNPAGTRVYVANETTDGFAYV
jgi:YVTN family beta-propeller protein